MFARVKLKWRHRDYWKLCWKPAGLTVVASGQQVREKDEGRAGRVRCPDTGARGQLQTILGQASDGRFDQGKRATKHSGNTKSPLPPGPINPTS